jgi:hypothetical protein
MSKLIFAIARDIRNKVFLTYPALNSAIHLSTFM